MKPLRFLPYSTELKLVFRNPPSPVQSKPSQVKHTALLQGSFLWQQQSSSKLVRSIQQSRIGSLTQAQPSARTWDRPFKMILCGVRDS